MASNKRCSYAKPASSWPKVKRSALVGPKRPNRPRPLATKIGVTTNRKRMY